MVKTVTCICSQDPQWWQHSLSPLESEMAAVVHALPIVHAGSALPQKKLLCWSCPSPHVPLNNSTCISGGLRILPRLPLLWCSTSQPHQALFEQPILVLSLTYHLKPQSHYLACPAPTDQHLRLGSASQHWILCEVSLCFAFHKPVTVLSSEATKYTPPSWLTSSPVRGLPCV